MQQAVESPSDAIVSSNHDVADPQLQDLPRPPRAQRTLALVLMTVCAATSIFMCTLLFSEVRYAASSAVPEDIGELSKLDAAALSEKLFASKSTQYVEAKATLNNQGAIRYARPFEGDSFRLQPVANNALIWVEIRVPEGMDGPRFVTPTSFTGRFVPLRSAGIRHSGLRNAVKTHTHYDLSPNAWLLVDGASPRASRWAIALFCLFAFFGLWNVVNIVRVARPIR